MILLFPTTVYAQNTSVQIPLSDNSKFATNGDLIAFSNSTTLSVAKDNKVYNCKNAFNAVKDLTIVGNYVVALDDKGNILPFSIKDNELKADETFFTVIDETNPNYRKNIKGIFSKGDEFYTLSSTRIRNYKLNTKDKHIFLIIDPNVNTDFDDFAICDLHLYAIKDGTLYCYVEEELNTQEDLENSKLTIDPNNNYKYTQITASDNNIFLKAESGLIKYNITNKDAKVLSSDIKASSDKFEYSKIDDKEYIFSHNLSSKNIEQYEIKGDKLEYVNTFSNIEYVHPSSNSIVKVAKANENIVAYMSPITLLSVFEIAKDSKFLVLDEQEGYYYVTDAKEQYGYIKKDSNILLYEYNKQTKLGNSAQVLHPGTKMYALPYDTSAVIKTFTSKELQVRLNVEHCLAMENNTDLWGWYKVSFLDENNEKITGYIQTINLSPYTSFTAPTVKKAVKVKAESFGEMVSFYTYADENSKKIADLVDGTEVLLINKFDSNSEWTQVQYGDDIGYIKTASIQLTGLTSVQIFVITIVTLVVVATIIIIIIFCIRRKHNSH